MKRMSIKLAATVLFLAVVGSVRAQSDTINIVTTAVPFLRISPDARAGGMGDLGAATSTDPGSHFYNLAKMPFAATKYGMSFTYTPWLKDLGLNDVYLLAASGFYQLDEEQTLSAGIRYFSLGNIQFTNNAGLDVGSGRPREFGIDFGYSRKLSDRIGLGLALRYIHSNLVGGYSDDAGNVYQAGNAVAGDIGFYYTGTNDVGQGWNFGVALSNLGTKIGYTKDATQKDYIPANITLGTTYRKVFDENNRIEFGIDLHKLMVPTPPLYTDDPEVNDSINQAYRNQSVVSSWFTSFTDAPGGFKEEMQEVQASIGAEYAYNNQFFVRAGYFYENKNKGNRQHFTVGVGVKYNVFGLNFSYLVPSGSGVNRNPLSNTLRFGLVLDLNDDNSGGGGSTPEE